MCGPDSGIDFESTQNFGGGETFRSGAGTPIYLTSTMVRTTTPFAVCNR